MASAELQHIHDEFTECSICFMAFRTPKMLPCLHTFCLGCLDELGRRQQPGDNIACPLCRRPCVIPADGFATLPTNFVTSRLVELKEIFSIGTGVMCDVCTQREETGTERTLESPSMNTQKATFYCVECMEKMCAYCAKGHRSYKMSRSHKILEVGKDDNARVKELLKSRTTRCEQHPNENLSVFCSDCCSPICVVCSVLPQHKDHVTDIAIEAALRRAILHENAYHASMRICKFSKLLDKLELDEKAYISETDAVEKSIQQKTNAIIKLVKNHSTRLIDEAKKLKETVLQRNEETKKKIRDTLGELETVRKLTVELSEQGTNAEVAGMSRKMEARWTELDKIQHNILVRSLTFSPSFDEKTLKCTAPNIVGKVSVVDIDRSDHYSTNPVLKYTIDGAVNVSGLALLDNQLFVLRQKTDIIDVIDTTNRNRSRQITVRDLRDPNDLVVCTKNKCLYVGDFTGFVLKVSLQGEVQKKWEVGGEPRRLSVSVDGLVFVTCGTSRTVNVCLDSGVYEPLLQLKSELTTPLCTLQLSKSRYVVSHGIQQNETIHRVCLIDDRANVLSTYGGLSGSGVGQLKCPVHCVLDDAGYVFVADSVNNRVVLLDTCLRHVRDLVTRDVHGLMHPRRLVLDEQHKLLYVGTVDGKVMIVGLG